MKGKRVAIDFLLGLSVLWSPVGIFATRNDILSWTKEGNFLGVSFCLAIAFLPLAIMAQVRRKLSRGKTNEEGAIP